MTMNLVQHRSEPSVWDRQANCSEWDAERWLMGAIAGTCLVAGFRRRSLSGLLLVIGAGGLAWWATSGVDDRRHRRGRLRAALPSRSEDDAVGDASAASFPASDAPALSRAPGRV